MWLRSSGLKFIRRNQKTFFCSLTFSWSCNCFARTRFRPVASTSQRALSVCFSSGGVLHIHRVQPVAAVDLDSGHGAVDDLDSVLQVAVPHLAIECEPVYLEGGVLWRRRNFVDHVGAIRGIVDVGLEIVGQAVFGIVLFHQVSAEPEFEHEIDTDLDQRFADDWAIIWGPSTTATVRFGNRLRRYAAARCSVAPPPITITSLVMGFWVSMPRTWCFQVP